MLSKIIRKTFLKNKQSFIVIGILIMLGTLICVGANVGIATLNTNNENFAINSVQEDFSAYLYPGQTLSVTEQNKIETDYDLIMTEKQYVDLVVDQQTEKTIRIYNHGSADIIDIPHLYDGLAPTNSNQIMISVMYANKNNIVIDDIMALNNRDYKVTGTFYPPNYILAIEDSSVFADSNNFGIAFVADDTFDKI